MAQAAMAGDVRGCLVKAADKASEATNSANQEFSWKIILPCYNPKASSSSRIEVGNVLESSGSVVPIEQQSNKTRTCYKYI